MGHLQDPHPSPLPERVALSFLGIGTPPDRSSWGGMLSITGQKYIKVSPWLAFFPSLAVSIAVFGFNLLGDTLRDALDPRLRGLQER
jgi:peptide/nickel transport system permease protein